MIRDFAFIGLLTSAGCIPIQMTRVIATDGIVLDQDTRQPIDAATIAVVVDDKTIQTTSTDAAGRFFVAEQTYTWWRPMLPLPLDPALPFARVVASKDGYRLGEVEFQRSDRRTPGEVLIERDPTTRSTGRTP